MRLVTLLLAIFATVSGVCQSQAPIFVYPSPGGGKAEAFILEHGLRERVNVTFSYDEGVEQQLGIYVLPQDKSALHVPDLREAADVMRKVMDGEKVNVAKLVKSRPKNTWRIEDVVLFGVPVTDKELLQALGAVAQAADNVQTARPQSDHAITQGLRHWPLRQSTSGVSVTGNTIELDEDGLIWAIDKGDYRVVASTITPDLQMLADERFLDFLARAVLWIADELQDNGWPNPGFGGNGAPDVLEAMREAIAFVPKDAPSSVAEVRVSTPPEPATPIDWQISFDKVEARYLTFEATSPQAGDDFATLAEFIVLDADGKELPRKDWRVVSSSSEQPPKQKAANILDGDIATIWHSRYINGIAKYPHSLRIDMRSSQSISGVICKPRAGSKTGAIRGYRLYASDSAGRGDLIAKGDFQ